jgi:hypothetical protein
MDWMNFLEQVFELVVYPVLSLAGAYLTYFISVKIKELKQKTNDDTAKKYLDLLDETVQKAVLATTQTYVDSLKSQGKFDTEAQKVAFKQTYDAVMKVLTADAVKYITESVGDLETYVTNKIEAEVKISKSYENK